MLTQQRVGSPETSSLLILERVREHVGFHPCENQNSPRGTERSWVFVELRKAAVPGLLWCRPPPRGPWPPIPIELRAGITARFIDHLKLYNTLSLCVLLKTVYFRFLISSNLRECLSLLEPLAFSSFSTRVFLCLPAS